MYREKLNLEDANLLNTSSVQTKNSATLSLQVSEIDSSIQRATKALLSQQNENGYWCYELEADCTIPAEYIIMMHFMDEIDPILQTKITNYLRQHQQAEGGWPLYFAGKFDISCTTKCYLALKLAGDDPDEPHMEKARTKILNAGGAANCNVFTMLAMAMFEQVPWSAVPIVPVEIMVLPRWFPFHISKVAYWSRTVTVPLSILCTHRVKARNPQQVDIQELFISDPAKIRLKFPFSFNVKGLFVILEKIAKIIEPLTPGWLRQIATNKAEAWFVEHLNGDGGLGAIFPAMVNAYEALDYLGYKSDDPIRIAAKKAIDDLLVITDETAYCQPCNSPIWDTGLACLALQEVNGTEKQVGKALDWLQTKQLLTEKGDWQDQRPDLEPGGWAFQFQNDFYPDLDDTAVVAWAMQNTHDSKYQFAINRATNWLMGMQSSNGGFASFEIDNFYEFLNEIPFADHGALLDPPSADVSARCLTLFGTLDKLKQYQHKDTINRCMSYLADQQESSGAWFGRWGTNYIYGTWSVLVALDKIGVDKNNAMVQRAVTWLKSCQRDDGGWGESNDSYIDDNYAGENTRSTSFQTAWAMLALMAAGEKNSFELQSAVNYLFEKQKDHGLWHDECFTAPGFPRVFHLKYHSYDKIFPLWALAQFRNLNQIT
ncbi:MAG: squalene--hopene cyclase [Gammaproteobacteria bacterium]